VRTWGNLQTKLGRRRRLRTTISDGRNRALLPLRPPSATWELHSTHDSHLSTLQSPFFPPTSFNQGPGQDLSEINFRLSKKLTFCLKTRGCDPRPPSFDAFSRAVGEVFGPSFIRSYFSLFEALGRYVNIETARLPVSRAIGQVNIHTETIW
jgi:hypothetical protein